MTSQAAAHESELDTYLAELAAALPGPRRRRNAVVNEVADGLSEATRQHSAQGLTAHQARQAAIAEFGPPEQLAVGFADELTVASARQAIAALLATGPVVGIWWLLLLAPAAWWQQPYGLWTAIPAIPLVGVVVLSGLTVLATTGQLTRWLPETTPTRALALAVRLSTACIAVDLTMLLVLVARALTDQPAWPPLLAAATVTASLTRLACTIHATHRLRRHGERSTIRKRLLARHA